MIIGAIIVGVLILVLITYIERCDNSIFGGVLIGIFIMTLALIEVCLISIITEKPKPSAIDVYRGKTELEITSVNGTPIDTVVVFKKKNNYEK